MRKCICLAALCLLVACLAGAGETIRVLGGNAAYGDTLKILVPQFEKDTGIKVQYEMYGEEQLTQKLTVEFTAGSSDIDVYMTRPLQEARLMKKNQWCADLTEYVKNDSDYDYDDIIPAAIDGVLIDGVLTSIPVVTESEMLFYRKDIFQERGLKVPDTLAEMEELAKQLTDKPNEFYGFISRGMRSPLVTQFSSFLYGFGSDWFDAKTRTSLIDTPDFLAAVDYYANMLKNYGPPGVTNMNWYQAEAIFQQGKGAMYTDASSHMPNMFDVKKSAIADKVGFALFPAGPKMRRTYFVTAWGLGMSSQSKKKDLAWKFIRYMSDKERSIQFQGEYGNQSARKSSYETADGVKMFPEDYAKAIADSIPYGVSYDRPQVTSVLEARDMIGEVVVTAIEGGDFKSAAKRAHAKFQELLDREKDN